MRVGLIIIKNDEQKPVKVGTCRNAAIDIPDVDLKDIKVLGLITDSEQYDDNNYFYYNAKFVNEKLMTFHFHEMEEENKILRKENEYLKSLNTLFD